jgi:hypothetical protein
MLRAATVVGFLALSIFAPFAFCAGDGKDAWGIVLRTLAWEKQWYGSFYGEKCLVRMVGKKTRVVVLINKREQTLGYSCKTGAAIRAETTSFVAHVDGTNIIFGGTISPFAEASVIAAGSEESCAVDEDDVAKQIARLKEGYSFLTAIPAISVANSGTPTTGFDDFVRRSVAMAGHRSPSGSSGEQRPLVNPTDKLRIGAWLPGDPLVIAGDESAQNLYLLRAPSEGTVMDGSFCGVVFSADRYSGRDQKSKVRRARVLESLKKNFLSSSRLIEAR